MSPNVGNFVHDLVEMAKAMEELPIVKNQRDEAVLNAEVLRHTVADREESILKLKSELTELNAKLRSVEAERDDASFRVLEVQDTFNKVFSQAGALLGAANQMNEILNPAKAGAQAEPVNVVSDPTKAQPSTTSIETENEASASDPLYHEPFPEGQSESGEHSNPVEAQSESSATSVGAPTADVASSATPPQPNYSGRRWSELSPAEKQAFWNHLDSDPDVSGGNFYWVQHGGELDAYYS